MTHANSNFHSRFPASIKMLNWLVCLASVGMLASCSGQAGTQGDEAPALVPEAITAACTMQTVGLPCDPDGSGSATECEGVCWVGANRRAQCVSAQNMGLSVTDLNGRLCGDATGQNCASSCENGQCVNKNARLGTACRPTAQLSSCDGLCTLINGQPTCDRYTACNNIGLQGCTLRGCGYSDNTTGCQSYPLASGTNCDDGLSCTSGDACNGNGSCVPAVNSCGNGTGGVPANGTGGGNTGGATNGGMSNTGGAKNGGMSNTGGAFANAPEEDAGSDTSAPTEITGGGCAIGSRAPTSAWSLLSLLGVALVMRRRACLGERRASQSSNLRKW